MGATPTPHDQPGLPEPAFVRALFDWLEPQYDSAVVTYSLGQDLRWKSELVRRLNPRPGEKALDLASGTGLIYERLARRVGRNGVVGLDLNRAMLLGSLRRDRDRRVVLADSVRIPFRAASFDLVTAGYLFKYVPLESLGREIRRVLKPGGRFGGYDFSSPRRGTLAGEAYERYLRLVLPRLGGWFARGDERWPALLRFLGQIATTSEWEGAVEAAFRREGFTSFFGQASLGGAITWVWAR